jgi:glyoxylase-like metal-dependent hydrolase (beta-lactamase superfamily II)
MTGKDTNPTPLRAPMLACTVTEEGQRVAIDAYSWNRRELTKRLPLDTPWPAETEIAAALAAHGIAAQREIGLPVPRTIVPGVYLVSSLPIHTYLVDCGEAGLVLIDPGLPENFDATVRSIEALGFSAGNLRWVLNTHGHFDHSMGNRRFRDLGAKIAAHAADAEAIEKATRATAYFLLPPERHADYPKCPVDWHLSDGEEFRFGDRMFHVIHVPGHTDGSCAFLLQSDGQNLLFAGDAVLFDHRLAAQALAYADNRRYCASLEKLAKFTLGLFEPVRWDVLLPGHGALVLERAYVDVAKAWQTVRLNLLDGDPIEALPFHTRSYRAMMFGRPGADWISQGT